MHKIIKNSLTIPEQSKKRLVFDRPSCPDMKNKWAHERNCQKRKVKEQKAHIEDLKAVVKERTPVHETTISDIQNKDQICNHALEVM